MHGLSLILKLLHTAARSSVQGIPAVAHCTQWLIRSLGVVQQLQCAVSNVFSDSDALLCVVFTAEVDTERALWACLFDGKAGGSAAAAAAAALWPLSFCQRCCSDMRPGEASSAGLPPFKHRWWHFQCGSSD
jgi:hypothetical protein